MDIEVVRNSGVTPRVARHRAKTGRYVRVRRGVYGINGAVPSWRQAVRAVVLAHPGLAASHETGLRLLGGLLPEWGDTIHVSGDLGERCRLVGVTAHRTGTFEPGDLTERFGIPCTSPIRVVLDLSGSLEVAALGNVVDDFLRRRLLTLAGLRARVARTRPAPGRSVATLRRVLARRIPGYDPGESALEAKIVLALTARGVPLPTQQHKVNLGGRRYRLDMCWPEHKVYLEGNSFGWHQLSTDLENDARRQNRLVIDGWRPVEITWAMSEDEIASTVRAVLGLV